MKQFDVLDANTVLGEYLFLEASAGSGKTFTIVHLIVRLIVEQGVRAQEIVAVTFTRKAALQLKMRVSQQLTVALDKVLRKIEVREVLKSEVQPISCESLSKSLMHEVGDRGGDENLEGYLQAQFKKDPNQLCTRLTQALDEVAYLDISTVHSFAMKKEGGSNLHHFEREQSDGLNEGALFDQVWTRLENAPDSICSLLEEILIVRGVGAGVCLKKRNQDAVFSTILGYECFVKECTQLLSKDVKLTVSGNLEQSYTVMRSKLNQYFSTICSLPALIKNVLPQFKGICDRSGVLKEPFRSLINELDKLLNQIEQSKDVENVFFEEQASTVSALYLCTLLHKLSLVFSEKNLKKTKKTSESEVSARSQLFQIFDAVLQGQQLFLEGWLHLKEVLLWLREATEPFIEKTKDKSIQDYTLKRLVQKMRTQGTASCFLQAPKALIVDEFQDTDPWQWEIFRTISETFELFFAVVGDPKQAIYAFRQADIYTYIEAKQWFVQKDQHSICSLEKNFRSDPRLVEALNAFFGVETPQNKDVFSHALLLGGREKGDLRVDRVAAGKSQELTAIQAAPLEFWTFHDKDKLWFEKTIQKFAQHWHQFPKSQSVAILVADHRQGAAVAKELERLSIPCQRTRPKSLKDSPLGPSVFYLISAFAKWPRNKGLRFCLGSLLFGWSHIALQRCFDAMDLRDIVEAKRWNAIWHHLAFLLQKQGLSIFWGELDSLQLSEDGVTLEQRLAKIDLVLLQEYRQFRTLLLAWWLDEPCLDALQNKLLRFLSGEKAEEIAASTQTNSVSILTVHASKGLEFDWVVNVAGNCPARQGRRKGGFEGKGYVEFAHNLVSIRKDNENCLVPVSVLNSSDVDQVIQDRESERFRLLYVSMTRAQSRQTVVWSVGDEKVVDTSIELSREDEIDLNLLHDRVKKGSQFSVCDLWALFHSWHHLIGRAFSGGYRELEDFGKQVGVDKSVGALAWLKKVSFKSSESSNLLQSQPGEQIQVAPNISWCPRGLEKDIDMQTLSSAGVDSASCSGGISTVNNGVSLAQEPVHSVGSIAIGNLYGSKLSSQLKTNLSSFSKWAQQRDPIEQHTLNRDLSVLDSGNSTQCHNKNLELEQKIKVPDLPSGSVFGELLHLALEKWWSFTRDTWTRDDKAICLVQYRMWLQNFCQKHSLLRCYEDVFVEMVEHVLDLPLHEIQISLREIPLRVVQVEARFLMHPPCETSNSLKTYYQGYIDLTFIVDNKVYFVDYKSNHLGQYQSDYSQKTMWDSFYHHRYDIQSAIYAKVLRLYAQRLGSAYKLGGGFYIFARGKTYLFISNDCLENFDVF